MNKELWLMNNQTFMIFITLIMMFMINYKYILINLISLEFIMTFTIYFFYINNENQQLNSFMSLPILTVMICDGILGLTILVLLINNYGNDMQNSLNLLNKW